MVVHTFLFLFVRTRGQEDTIDSRQIDRVAKSSHYSMVDKMEDSYLHVGRVVPIGSHRKGMVEQSRAPYTVQRIEYRAGWG